jgi:hypothetical protein
LGRDTENSEDNKPESNNSNKMLTIDPFGEINELNVLEGV